MMAEELRVQMLELFCFLSTPSAQEAGQALKLILHGGPPV